MIDNYQKMTAVLNAPEVIFTCIAAQLKDNAIINTTSDVGIGTAEYEFCDQNDERVKT